MSADGCKLAGAVSAYSGALGYTSGRIYVLEFPRPPALAIANSGGDLVLPWTVSSMNLALQAWDCCPEDPCRGRLGWERCLR
ncbi:MAG: hypothetical protein ACLQVX_10970 [Limisphaerales bacterium]